VRSVTLQKILTETQQEILREERKTLAEVYQSLSNCEASAEDLTTLGDAIRQLDALFMLVVVGEFNSGKSAFINALLGERLLAEGVTPTTSKIHLIQHSEATHDGSTSPVMEVSYSPAELLRELTIVDTPGTNALDRRHEAITDEFVPRSDLVVFVTSADRPFSESERAFLERIRQWGKKVVVVVNKIDILRSTEEVAEIERYIAEHSRQLLDMTPPIFPISALRALDGQRREDNDAFRGSRLAEVEGYLRTTLDEGGRVRLKLGSPLGVAANLLVRYHGVADELLESLAEDLKILDDIERQLSGYAADVDREFGLRLADIDNLLHGMEKRGLEFFDDRLRLRRLPELFDKQRLRTDFERVVVADVPQGIEARVESIIDWLVESDLNQWQAVVQHVNRRRSEHADRIVGDVASRFEYDRAGLLDTVGRAARKGLARYDRKTEAARLAEGVQRAVAGTALVEVGAIGLGATISLVASGSVADTTGILAASTMAALGLFILPHRRRRAKRELSEKIAGMRTELMGSLTEQFGSEADRGRSKIKATVAPYDRFVRAERGRLEQRRRELIDLQAEVERLRMRIEALGPSTGE
jgi:small GTP-binding protein